MSRPVQKDEPDAGQSLIRERLGEPEVTPPRARVRQQWRGGPVKLPRARKWLREKRAAGEWRRGRAYNGPSARHNGSDLHGESCFDGPRPRAQISRRAWPRVYFGSADKAPEPMHALTSNSRES